MRGNRRRSAKQASWSLPQRKLRFRRPAVPRKARRSILKEGRFFERIPPSSPLYLLAICLVVAVVATAFVFHLHVRFEGVRLGYETSEARAKRARLVVERRELRLELATLKAPERVESEARERLAMKVPDHKQIIVIGKKKSALVASGRAR